MMAPHRILIWGVVLLLFGSVATHIKWGNIPRIGAAFGQFFPHGGNGVPPPRGETTEVRRERLRDAALSAGRTLLARPCDAEARRGYRDAVIDLARQRMHDMGCTVDYACNVEKNGFKEISFAYYATDKDRRISRQFAEIAGGGGGVVAGELGIYRLFIGHPEELAKVLSSIPLVREPACAGAKVEN